MTESTPNHPISVQSTQAHRLLFWAFQKGRSNICHPATKLPFFQSALQLRMLLRALSLPSFQNCLSGFVCLPVTDAVRVQLYRIASSPNTFPGPMVHNFLPCLVISTVPSVHKHQKTFQWFPQIMIGGKRCKRERGLWGGGWGERRTIVNNSFNGAGGFGGISMMLQCRCSGERLAVLET